MAFLIFNVHICSHKILTRVSLKSIGVPLAASFLPSRLNTMSVDIGGQTMMKWL